MVRRDQLVLTRCSPKHETSELDDVVHLDRLAAALVLPAANTDDDSGHSSTQVS